MNELDRITHDPQVMGGKPCIRGLRVTVGAVLGLLAEGATWEQILADYPYLEALGEFTAQDRLLGTCDALSQRG